MYQYHVHISVWMHQYVGQLKTENEDGHILISAISLLQISFHIYCVLNKKKHLYLDIFWFVHDYDWFIQ